MNESQQNGVRPPIARPPRAGYFGHRPVRDGELPGLMWKHTYTGAMAMVYMFLTHQLFFFYFGNEIGLSRFQWGLMAGVSSWLIMGQLFSALLTERVGRRKLIWWSFAFAGRSLRFVGIILALWFWKAGRPYAGVALMVGVWCSTLFGFTSHPPWLSWLASIIPETEHGTFWGRRAAWTSLFAIAALVPAAYLMDAAPQEHKLSLVTAIFAVGTFVGLLDIVIHGTIPEPAMALPERKRRLLDLLKPVRDPHFRRWLAYNGCWTFSIRLGVSLSLLHFLEGLEIRKDFVGGTLALTCVSLATGMFTAGWTGRLVDRLGTRPVLFWGHLFWALKPAIWVFATPRTAILLLSLGSVLDGTARRAAMTARNKLITRMPAEGEVATYAAVSTTLGSLAGGLGAMTAGALLGLLGDWEMSVGWLTIEGFRVLFIASACLGLLSTFLLVPRIRNLQAGGGA